MRETTSAVRRSLRIATLTVNGAVCSALLTQPLYAGTAQFALSSLNNGSSGSGNGENGFLLNGIDADDRSGWSVSSAGDINGDGLDDVIIGAPHADSNNVSQVSQDGESYVVFGGGMVGVAGELELSTLDGSDGFVLNGVKFRDNSGHSVSAAGDVNGDGVDDVIIGMNFSFPSPEAGASFIVFGGGMVGGGGELDLSTLDGSDGFVINGIDGSMALCLTALMRLTCQAIQ